MQYLEILYFCLCIFDAARKIKKEILFMHWSEQTK